MAAAYDIQTFLLDRANIHDTVIRLGLNSDLNSTEGYVRDVYAPEVVIDYTSLFGGAPLRTTARAWAEMLQPMLGAYDARHHVVSGVLIELPQPAPGVARPDRCAATANVSGHMVRRTARGGPIMHNGGRYALELVRLPELEARGLNPWRISSHATTLAWEDGSTDVMAAVSGIGH
ncbi:hypothetical protein GGS23DRAFT_594024 [Durotheca rogersii]|uniref:uncharacterized protein n=1 Tax=Durotheca rogersii TaxID=419775 RepID=UPI00221FE4FE|nr:uncharacterized protein GGS23DRAFT_594024 [Durotheca rogersii]KAI5865855.1 hypothetical protein GGS23DRAFT_594024 [Durotheca rogersii]